MSLKDYNFSSMSSVAAISFLVAIAVSIIMGIYLTIDHFIPEKHYPHKYCYFVTKNGQVLNGIAADYRSGLKKVNTIFQGIDDISYNMGGITNLRPCDEVEILKYPDSSSAKIRFKVMVGHIGGGDYLEEETGYVPRYLIHDSLSKDCPKDSSINKE